MEPIKTPPTREEVCDFYADLCKKMKNKNLFCRLPMPHYVKDDPRLIETFKEHFDGISTCDAQIEYHRKMQEDPENASKHYIEYASKLGIEIDEPAVFTKPDKTPLLECIDEKDEVS